MQALSQSAFLQALGYAIANSLWQAALVWLLVAGANGLFKFTSHVKYKVALAAQFSAFIWFLLTLQFYYAKCSEAIAQLQYSGLTNANAFELQPGTHSFTAILLSAILKGEKSLPYLSIAYLLLLCVFCVRWIKGYRQTQVIKNQGIGKIDVDWRLFVQRISDMLAIKQKVQIFVSDFAKSPLTVGFLKPLILIPIASINNLSTEQLEAVILHELAHIKRADYLFNIIQSVIEVALFFNPFTQLISKIIRRERENSCDDWVLQFQYDPAMYAQALLQIAIQQTNPTAADAFVMNAKGNKDHDLLWRVKRMLHQKERSFQYRNRMFALLLITGVVSSVAWLQPGVKNTTAAAATAAKTQQPVVVEPLAVKIDNPLYNPISFFNGALKEEVQKATEDATKEIAKSTSELANIGPAVSNKIETLNTYLPTVISTATSAAANALTNVKLSSDDEAALKKLNINLDSLKLGNIQAKIGAGMKNIDWTKINSGIAKAKDEVKIQLKNADWGGFSGAYITDLINKSLDVAAKSIPQGNNAKEDDGDDDNTQIVAPGGYILKANKATKPTKAHDKRLIEVKRVTDSTHRTFSKAKSLDIESEDGSTSNGNTTLFNTAVAPQVSYSSFAPKYYPANFDLNSKLNLTINTDNNVSVSSKDNSTLVAVKQDDKDDSNYAKKITIETLDPNGQRHIFHVTIEMYQ